ncbi:glyoxylate/hydroxypyruvate reductase A [Pelomonas sp. SE-A7]|uniref:2-hydroxyacid dehydrogenase n=1 Tax=Pelomonas sp. SE-A7 TaxID=3054953 RepID=UPI00259CDF30|nr:glyoxylate/hydroxypyruvate reductase A [Pelomonas sp. SE-A7]MDM4766964.1 glyoxylate/hydroxypyruvate reductase A [Pelomonas sp. SE-A7]
MSLYLVGHWSGRNDAAAQDERAGWLSALQEALPHEEWLTQPPTDAAQAAQVEVAIVANPPAGSLQGLPNLKLIQSVWAGVDKLLSDTTLPAGVPLARMVDPAMNEAMVHTALWAVLSLHRRFFELAVQQREAQWQPLKYRRAAEWRVLVLGLGELGGRVARALAAQGYAVSGWATRPVSLSGVACVHGEDALAWELASANTVVNLLPLTLSTRDFFDARRLGQMKKGATLVNLARGAHVVEDDLLAALDVGQVGHAVLDVFQQEPLPTGHRFWSHPQVTVLPHTAAQTDARTAAAVVAANLLALRAGRPLLHEVQRQRGY